MDLELNDTFFNTNDLKKNAIAQNCSCFEGVFFIVYYRKLQNKTK